MLSLHCDCGIVFVELTEDLYHFCLLIKIRTSSKLMVEMLTGLCDVTNKHFMPGLYSHHRFIQKQGLDRTFVECDNHMWRVGTRPLPKDVTIDGGSDWIAISRRYAHYLVTGNDDMLVRMKRIFEFSLLPAEVGMATVVCGVIMVQEKPYLCCLTARCPVYILHILIITVDCYTPTLIRAHRVLHCISINVFADMVLLYKVVI